MKDGRGNKVVKKSSYAERTERGRVEAGEKAFADHDLPCDTAPKD